MRRNELGIHMFVFTAQRTREEIANAAAHAAAAGYAILEVPLLKPDAVDPTLKAVFEELGITPIGSIGLDPSTDIASADPDTIRRGETLLLRALERAHDLGAPLLTGVVYGLLGHHTEPPTREGRANAQRVLSRVAEAAAARGMNIGLEPVNRYESNLLNTAEQALVFMDEIGADNLVLHLDVYHMNIEEPGYRQPVLAAGGRLGYVHIDESHRGYLGTGTIDFPGFFAALAEIDYAGPITFEGFSPAVLDGRLGVALALWRELWNDSDDLARHAHRFISEHLEAASAVPLPAS
jgi:D-psicose/D-tagatose/L-ribulose 3-epimerase